MNHPGQGQSGQPLLDVTVSLHETESWRKHSLHSGFQSTFFTMTIKFLCPSGHRLKADSRDANRLAACPICGYEVIVPRPEDLGLSSLQEEDSDAFVYVSIEGDQAIAATPRPLLPRTPDGFSPRLVQGYRPDERRVESLKWLTFFLGLTIVFSAAPALSHVNLFTAPGWARAALLLAVLQGCYLAWMLSAPDWSTIRTVTIVFGVAGVIYAAALALILVAPADRPLPLGHRGSQKPGHAMVRLRVDINALRSVPLCPREQRMAPRRLPRRRRPNRTGPSVAGFARIQPSERVFFKTVNQQAKHAPRNSHRHLPECQRWKRPSTRSSSTACPGFTSK